MDTEIMVIEEIRVDGMIGIRDVIEEMVEIIEGADRTREVEVHHVAEIGARTGGETTEIEAIEIEIVIDMVEMTDELDRGD